MTRQPRSPGLFFAWKIACNTPHYILNKYHLVFVNISSKPNPGGRIYVCPVLRFEMKLFNRYGEQMWSTNDPGQYWDGTFKVMLQQLGVYFYLIRIRFDTPWVKEELYKGHVTLVR